MEPEGSHIGRTRIREAIALVRPVTKIPKGTPAFIYDAFISYSHAADSQFAPFLQGAIQRFARPWYRLRTLRIFRDQTGLTLTPELWPDMSAPSTDPARSFCLPHLRLLHPSGSSKSIVHGLVCSVGHR